MRILLVEDDPMIGAAAESALRREGYSVDWARDGRAAELALAHDVYDAVLLDLSLPRLDGMQLLARARKAGSEIPVIIVTARDGLEERLAGLDGGADDYVIKPFEIRELLARLRALLRRRANRASPTLSFGAICLDPVEHRVTLRGAPVELPPKEFAQLHALLQRPGAVIAREKLESSLYGWREEVTSNTVEVHLHHLRRKLGASSIQTLRGVGYRLAEVE